MIVAITGSRHWAANRYPEIRRALARLDPEEDSVILGDARGVDQLALQACNDLGLEHIVKVANWNAYGRAAGPIRNKAMLDHNPDELWWFHDDIFVSRGTANCVRQAEARGITVLRG